LKYSDLVYQLTEQLPRSEDYNLKSQLQRAATSISLNIAEGSTSQTDAEQTRFLGFAIRSLKKTVAYLHLIRRRNYLGNPKPIEEAYRFSEKLHAK
jgi:four helix bundle protein